MAKKMSDVTVAVIGATDMVGKIFLRVLAERSFPVGRLRALTVGPDVGGMLELEHGRWPVQAATADQMNGVDIAFFATDRELSRRFAPLVAEQGGLAIDNTGSFRSDPQVPLIVPEVNGYRLVKESGIISNPNCSAAPLVVALQPLQQKFGLRRVIVATYQAVSGAGEDALGELRQQQAHILQGKPVRAENLPVAGSPTHHIIADNAIPQVGLEMDHGYTDEEIKVIRETRQILSLPNLPVAATCVRLPIPHGHSEAVYVELEKPFTLEAVREVLRQAPSIALEDNLKQQEYPMPSHARGDDLVHVGRLRHDLDHARGLQLWIVSDNLRKGAATNAVQIAELWLQQQE